MRYEVSVYDCDPVVPYLLEMINEHLQAGTDWLWNVIRSGESRLAAGGWGAGGWGAGPVIIEQWVELTDRTPAQLITNG